jgi:hypothetical protein
MQAGCCSSKVHQQGVGAVQELVSNPCTVLACIPSSLLLDMWAWFAQALELYWCESGRVWSNLIAVLHLESGGCLCCFGHPRVEASVALWLLTLATKSIQHGVQR